MCPEKLDGTDELVARLRPDDLVHGWFVCSKNQWRSPTAEAIYRNDDRISVRSRGTARSAVQTIRSNDIVWADVILVMEDKHRQRILADFPGESKFKPMHVLDIPDDYQFMDAELIELIKLAVDPIVGDRVTSEIRLGRPRPSSEQPPI